MRAGRIRSIEIDLIGTRTGDFPACSIVPQPTTLPRALKKKVETEEIRRVRQEI
jgi:hypothetical protein